MINCNNVVIVALSQQLKKAYYVGGGVGLGVTACSSVAVIHSNDKEKFLI